MCDFPANREQAEAASALADLLIAEAVPATRRALWLQGRYSPELCRTAQELLLARERAARYYPLAQKMYFTKNALEQATTQAVADYHSSLFPSDTVVVDAGCGVGSDSLALARRGSKVIGVDINPVHCLYARLNSEITGLADKITVVCADLLRWPLGRAHWLFADPMRRNSNGRLMNPEEWTPPLSYYLQAKPGVPNGVVKASPMLKPDPALLSNRQMSYLEFDGECKEALISWGDCARYLGMRVAVNVNTGSEMLSEPVSAVRFAPVGNYLIDPSSAVLAADMLPQLACNLNAWRISPYCGYLSSDEFVSSPFAQHYRVTNSFKFQKNRMRAYLLDQSISKVILKKRGLPAEWGSELVKARKGDGDVGIFAAYPMNNQADVWISHLQKQ